MTNWDAAPNGAMWYGEIIFGGDGWTDYNYGYSNDEDPDPTELGHPEDTDILELKVLPCPSNPIYFEEFTEYPPEVIK